MTDNINTRTEKTDAGLNSPYAMITRWDESETLTLGNHFHGRQVLKKKAQTEELVFDPGWRVKCMGVREADVSKLSGCVNITSIQICMALKEKVQKEVNIAPLLCIEVKNEEPIYIELVSVDERGKEDINSGEVSNQEVGAAQVPIEFLNVVSNNWMLLGPEQIDDAFMAFKLDNTQGLDRLTGYHFNSKTNSLLFHKLCKLIKSENLISLNMHFGIDFNKFSQRTEFSFTPVIELKVKGGASDQLKEHADQLNDVRDGSRQDYKHMPTFIPKIKLDGANEDEGSWYFEYIRPCPPC